MSGGAAGGGELKGSVTWSCRVSVVGDKESMILLPMLWRTPCSAGLGESSGGGSGSDDGTSGDEDLDVSYVFQSSCNDDQQKEQDVGVG